MTLIQIVQQQQKVFDDSFVSSQAASAYSHLEIEVGANTDTNTDDIQENHLDNYLVVMSDCQ